MAERLARTTLFDTPDVALDHYVSQAVQRTEPIPVESGEGRQLYRALALAIWRREQRPVTAVDIRDLWERIDALKRGSPVHYGIWGIHFWAAEFANALAAESVALDPAAAERLNAWLDDWPSICILGQTGRGKSTTINRLFGARMAETSHHKACTSTVTEYRLVTGQCMNRPTGVILWDVPGYGDERMDWDDYVKLYRRLAKRCDVVLFMLDHERTLPDDLKMFRKLRKRVRAAERLVVAINKADLFPGQWRESGNAPDDEMLATLDERVGIVCEALDLRSPERVVAFSALKGWNIGSLLSTLVNAAGAARAPQLARSLAHAAQQGMEDGNTGSVAGSVAERFGVTASVRSKLRSFIDKRRKS